MKRPDSGLVALSVGMLGSGAANTAWAWPTGPVHVIAGLFATALVPISMHLWPRVPITGNKTRVVRGAVMTYICLAAAGVNLIHATWLLTDYRPMDTFILESRVVEVPARSASWVEIVMAVLLITAVEAVMVMASLARRATPVQEGVGTSDASPVEDHTPAPVVEPVEAIPPVEPEEPAVPDHQTAQPMSFDDAVAWGIPRDAGAKLMMKHCGLSEHYAKKAREAVIAARALRVA